MLFLPPGNRKGQHQKAKHSINKICPILGGSRENKLIIDTRIKILNICQTHNFRLQKDSSVTLESKNVKKAK